MAQCEAMLRGRWPTPCRRAIAPGETYCAQHIAGRRRTERANAAAKARFDAMIAKAERIDVARRTFEATVAVCAHCRPLWDALKEAERS